MLPLLLQSACSLRLESCRDGSEAYLLGHVLRTVRPLMQRLQNGVFPALAVICTPETAPNLISDTKRLHLDQKAGARPHTLHGT